MKQIKILTTTFCIICLLSSCSIFKGGKCDCPKFSKQLDVEQSLPDRPIDECA